MRSELRPIYTTQLGRLYEADCLAVLRSLPDQTVDLVFADPPFNLSKKYGQKRTDNLPESEYSSWNEAWIAECCRILKPGGSFFIYNLPKWNIESASYLNSIGMNFRNWIAVEHKSSLPIKGRLYPAHYSLLYYTKGKARTFRRIRTPIETCRHCGKDIKDYGGHRKAMNPKGVSLKDIWTDIKPVRHSKFKPASRQANALSTKLLERVIEMSTVPGDVVVDPFGGSGTTYAVCEQRSRQWIGIEIEDTKPIVERLTGEVCNHFNTDYVDLDESDEFRQAAE